MSVNVKQNGSLTKVGGLYHDSTLGQELDEFDVSTADVLDADYILTKSGSTWYRKALSKVRDYIDKILAPIENGTTASQAYAIGEHFVRNGDFCTAKTTIASNATLTENTNYVTSAIADFLTVKTGTMTIPSAVSSWCEFTGSSGNKLIFRQGNIVKVNTIVKITDMPTLSAAAFILELPWENSQGVAVFGQLNAYGQPYTMRTEAVYIGSGTTNKNKVGIRSSLPNGSYYVSIQYMTNDPF